jgi:hypothetical protein
MFPFPNLQLINRSALLKGPSSSSSSLIERHFFGQSLLHHLNCLNAILQQVASDALFKKRLRNYF